MKQKGGPFAPDFFLVVTLVFFLDEPFYKSGDCLVFAFLFTLNYRR